jgi:S1-C subfamily serine protease
VTRSDGNLVGRFTVGDGGNPFESGFRDGRGEPADGTAAFFPIIQRLDGQPWVPIATGFFISHNGLFVTAKHVVVDERGELLPELAGIHLLRSENRIIVRSAVKVRVHPKADVAVGFLYDQEFAAGRGQTLNKAFESTRNVPDVGDRVVMIAFPNSELTESSESFRLKFETAVSSGVIDEYHPGGRDSVMLPGRCFQTDMDIQSGASGGPVASGSGAVFGINSTGMNGAPVGYVSSVLDVLELEIGPISLPSGEIRERMTVADAVEVGLVVMK